MKLNELTTSYEKRRVIEFGTTGNKAVCHYVNVRQVRGVLWMSEPQKDDCGDERFNLYLFYLGIPDGALYRMGLLYPSFYDSKNLYDGIVESGLDTFEQFTAYCDARMKNGQFINNAVIAFVRQWNPERAAVYAKYREDFYAKKHEQERIEAEKRRAQEEAAEAEAMRIRDEQDAKERAKYHGYADSMTAMRFGKFKASMEKLIRTTEYGIQTYRDFVESLLRDGWIPKKCENVVTTYGSKWNPKESKPRTEYRIAKESLSYKVSKSEYDYATYLMEHPECFQKKEEN